MGIPISEQEVKTCGDCQRSLPVMRFHRKRVGSDGRQQYQSYCKRCGRARATRSRSANVDWYRYRDRERYNTQHRVAQRLRKYGLSQKGYDDLLEIQEGRCAICRVPFPRLESACVDHDHKTGAVRGLLCDLCNRALGFLKDDPVRAERLVNYLRR